MDKKNKEDVLDFWFLELGPKDWYKKDLDLDKKIKDQFLPLYHQVVQGETFAWRKTIEGRLAEILVLDQFSRNMFRGSSKAFQYDCLALALSQEASCLKSAQDLPTEKRAFLYMPFMHSESLLVHKQAVKLFAHPGLEESYRFELKHKEIIEKFGRYPHRNEILGRKSTAQEIEFLKGPGSSF